MDQLKELGALGLANRLRRLADRISREGADVYTSQNVDFEPRWFVLYFLLAHHGEAVPVTDAAQSLGLSHPAIIQLSDDLIKKGLVHSIKDEHDGRRRLLALTTKGRDMLPALERIWDDFEAAYHSLFNEIGYDIITIIERIEQALDGLSIQERVNLSLKARQLEEVEIVEYCPEYGPIFKELNYEWLQKYFEVEPMDEEVLRHPDQSILANGGRILFARVEGKIVGTCALLMHSATTFEIAKMAVTEAYQGRQIGKKLTQSAIALARQSGAGKIFLLTNKKLTTAIQLYRQMGFTIGGDSHEVNRYKRKSFCMTLELK